MSSFVKDVATLSDAGDLTEVLKSVRELTHRMDAVNQEFAA